MSDPQNPPDVPECCGGREGCDVRAHCAAKAVELPDAIRVPLDELEADAAYILGRVAQDPACMPLMLTAITRRTQALRTVLLHTARLRAEAVDTARSWCDELGLSNDWPDDLALADVIEKRMMRPLHRLYVDVRSVVGTFRRDAERGYRTNDKTFVVDMLGRHLINGALAPTKPQDEVLAALERLLRAEEKYVRDTGLPQPDDLIQDAVNHARELLGWPAIAAPAPAEPTPAQFRAAMVVEGWPEPKEQR